MNFRKIFQDTLTEKYKTMLRKIKKELAKW